MAVDPARIRRRMQEAEDSDRRSLGVSQAREALRALAVVLDDEPHEERHSEAVLVQAS